jgi:aminomethyltransferase
MDKQARPEEGCALYAEHALLGARFDADGTVVDYAYERNRQPGAGNDVAYLADISHVTTLLFSGEGSSDFAYAGFGGKELAAGECAFEAVLTGDGTVASVPLLARTGEREYVSFDLSARSEVLVGWLSFLKSVSKDGYAPYATVQTEEATGTHAVLALWGNAATATLADYTSAAALPREGEIASCTLDKLPCIIARPPIPGVTSYMILLSPRMAVVLWRSLLSFAEVNPVGMRGLQESLRARLGWYAALDGTQQVRMGRQELLRDCLIRRTPDYVGARGL